MAMSAKRPSRSLSLLLSTIGTTHRHLTGPHTPASTLGWTSGAKRAASSSSATQQERVVVIGSGNWGTTVAKMVGHNVSKKPDVFNPEVRMWVHEENVGGRKLSTVINETHMNPKYLPGIALPETVRAEPDLSAAVKDATLLVFVLPHEFLDQACKTIKSVLDNSEPDIRSRVRAISLIKGLLPSSSGDPHGIELPSEHIRNALSPEDEPISVSVLSGANIALEIAKGQLTESTLGFDSISAPDVPLWTALFNDPRCFRIGHAFDLAGVELCGALKNVVALAAGIASGLGAGSNTRATVIRLGLVEMKRFADSYFGGMKMSTLFESCGVADMITSCTSGRNYSLARVFATRTSTTFAALESELLGGQKLQGVSTAVQVHAFLESRGDLGKFPLFRAVYGIAHEGWKPGRLLEEAVADEEVLAGTATAA